MHNLERRAPPPRPLNFETLRQQMQKRLAWRERQNAYGSGCALLSAEGPRMELTPTPRGPRTISEWERLWNLAPTGSKFVDFGRDSPTSARGDATVEDDTTVGANLDQIGPDAQ